MALNNFQSFVDLSNICPFTLTPRPSSDIHLHKVDYSLFPDTPIAFNLSGECQILQALSPHNLFQKFQLFISDSK